MSLNSMKRIQAGAVAFRVRNDQREFLLVTAKRSDEWIFPKGNVDTDETLEEAALRELREEAGVEGVTVAEIGRLTFAYRDESVEITYFLVQSGATRPNGEGRKIRWLPLEEALRLVTFDDFRDLLRRAAEEASLQGLA